MKLSKIMMGTAAVMMTFSMLLCSCQSTKASDETVVQGDADYSDAPVVAEAVIDAEDKTADSDVEADAVVETDSETDEYASYDKASIDEQQKKNNIWANLLISQNNSKFLEVDSCTFSTIAITGKLKQQDADLFINSKDFSAGFGSPILAAYYFVYMDQKTRSVFINAVDSYLSDFENKKLNRKDKKSIKRYGKSKVDLYWGLVKNQATNSGSTDALFGYSFKNKSPYFVITIYPTINEKRKTDDSVPEESMTLNYYFTKAQCKALAEFLREDNISQYYVKDVPKVEVISPDSY